MRLGFIHHYCCRRAASLGTVNERRPPLAGVIGAFAVIAGLLFVEKVGAGVFAGLTVTANILMSLVIDQYGLFGVHQHSFSPGRIAGAALMVAGITLISRF